MHEAGFPLVAEEVRLPLSNYRADVAGYAPTKRYVREPGDTCLMECKQSRADFLKDSAVEAEHSKEKRRLSIEMGILMRMLGIHLPDCRQGVSLFPEYDDYDFGELRHEKWRRLQARLAYLERRLKHGSKFAKIARYGCGTYCWLAVEKDVLRDKTEVPAGWGCLIRSGDSFEVWINAPRFVVKPEVKLKLLERIAGRVSRKCDDQANAEKKSVNDEGQHADLVEELEEKVNTN